MKNIQNRSLGDCELAEPVSDPIDRVIEWLLIGLLAFMPLVFGVVHAWSEEVVLALVTAMVGCLGVKMLRIPRVRLVWSWSYIPIVLFVLVPVLQLASLPASVVELISSHTVEVRNELLGDLPDSHPMTAMSLSLYRHGTRHDLRLLLAISAVFFVVFNTCRSRTQIKRLLAAIAVIGGGVALLALAQQSVLGNGKIYWFVPTYAGAFSGPFINHSHFSQFMNLSLGAALGLLFVMLQESFDRGSPTGQRVVEYIFSPEAKGFWLLLGVVIVGATTVFVSMSRGGMISMLIATAVMALAVVFGRKEHIRRGWIIAVVALVVFACLLYMGFDVVYDRLSTVRDLGEYDDRGQIVKDVALAWTQFPLLGTGLGTHQVVYPMFDRTNSPALASHAENEYAQAAEETGGVGFLLLALLAVFAVGAYFKNIIRQSQPIHSAAYGLGFGLTAILLHSFSDFGQHLPANATLSAISVALLLVLASRGRGQTQTAADRPIGGFAHKLEKVWLVVMLAALIWAIIGADHARVAEAHWDRALAAEQWLEDKQWIGSNAEYVDLISNAAAANQAQPGNIDYHYWTNVYRWRAISQTVDPNTGELLIPEQSMPFVVRIVDDLLQGAEMCPTYGATYCTAGQLMGFVLGNPFGEKLIERGYRLAPYDSTACYVAGMLDIEKGRIEESFEKLQKAVQLDGGLFREVAMVYTTHMERPDLALALALTGDNINRLSCLVGLLKGKDTEIAELVEDRLFELLNQRSQEADAPGSVFATLAGVYVNRGDCDKAIECYRRALTLDYDNTSWRLALARLLADTGQPAEAIRQAKICLRLAPQTQAAIALIEGLSVDRTP